jgi:hypothetical protein
MPPTVSAYVVAVKHPAPLPLHGICKAPAANHSTLYEDTPYDNRRTHPNPILSNAGHLHGTTCECSTPTAC